MVDLLDNEYNCEYCRDAGWVYTEGQPCPECQDGPTPELEKRIEQVQTEQDAQSQA